MVLLFVNLTGYKKFSNWICNGLFADILEFYSIF